MTWIGKMVGGAIGFALGGPIGAVAGAVFGHLFDEKEEGRRPEQRQAGPSMTSEETSQLVFFTACFSMLGKLARADGAPSEKEIASIRRFMEADLQLNPQSRKAAEGIFRMAQANPQPFEDFARQFYQHFHDRPELLEMMADILVRVAAADGVIQESEDRLIRLAANLFHFSEDILAQIKSRHVPQTNPSYQVLGCSPSDTDETIKSRYRKLARDFHPDTIASKGLPEEFVVFAHEKFREIQEAYEAIKKERAMV